MVAEGHIEFWGNGSHKLLPAFSHEEDSVAPEEGLAADALGG